MERLMRRRSLMMGNESTEESRNEMSSRPGAPEPLAKAMIFCFQLFRLSANRYSLVLRISFVCRTEMLRRHMTGDLDTPRIRKSVYQRVQLFLSNGRAMARSY